MLPSSFPLVLLSSPVVLTSILHSSFVANHSGTSIAIVEIVTESDHPTCTGIISAHPPKISRSSIADCLYALGAS